MFKVGCFAAIGLLVLAVVSFVAALSSQQPSLFAVAIVCLIPAGAFFSGGALFIFFSEYELPKRRSDKQAASQVRATRGNVG
jgi:hypothetical protein